MTVRVQKESLNLREELSKLNKPSGVAGEAMLRAETPQEQFNLIGAGRKNLIINGAFKVAQRGTSFTKSGSTYGGFGAIDRWAIYFNAQTLQRTENVINGVKKYCAKVTTNDATSTYLYTNIEAGSKLEGQTVSLSFWMRASRGGVSNGINNMRYNDDASYGNTVAYVDGSSTYSQMKFTTSTDWTYYSLKVNLGADTVGSSDTRNLFVLINPLLNQAGDWFEVADVQLELGSVATPFEHRSYGEELALCQRYYYRHAEFTNLSAVSMACMYTGTTMYTVVPFPTEMRSAPTLHSPFGTNYYSFLGNGTDDFFDGFVLNTATTKQAELYNNTNMSGVTGHAGWIRIATSGAGVAFLAFDAEL